MRKSNWLTIPILCCIATISHALNQAPHAVIQSHWEFWPPATLTNRVPFKADFVQLKPACFCCGNTNSEHYNLYSGEWYTGMVTIRFNAFTNKVYELQYCHELNSSIWWRTQWFSRVTWTNPLPTNSTGFFQVETGIRGQPSRFYRLMSN